MTEYFDDFLNALSNGREYDYQTISQYKLKHMNRTKLQLLISFFEEYGFIEIWRDAMNKVKTLQLKPRIVEFLTCLERFEPKNEMEQAVEAESLDGQLEFLYREKETKE